VQPQLFSEELRAAFRSLRGNATTTAGSHQLIMNETRLILAIMLASPVVAAAKTPTEWRHPMKPMMTSSVPLPVEGTLPSFEGGGEWLHSPPLTAAGLRGKVVLVDIWNYSCINWIRQVPYVRAWAEKYKDRGLVVIGVHSPEFGFETNVDNVRRAAKAMNVTYPIVMDSDHAIWNAFDNEAWPALYFVDAQGRLLGQERAEGFVSSGGLVRNKSRVYAVPARLALNQWALSGDWTVGGQPTVLNAANGRITIRFHARDLHLVMGAAAPGGHVRFRVLLDGRVPGTAHGLDVDSDGNGVAIEPRLYQLIRQTAPIADHTFEIEFLDAGVEAFSFTFG